MGGSLKDLDQAGFDSAVTGAVRPVLVDFWAPWCGPCRTMAPVLEEVANEHAAALDVFKVDVDANPEIASRFEIMSIPTLLLFEGGVVRKKLIGALAKKRLEEELKPWLEA